MADEKDRGSEFSLEEILNGNYESDETFSLESILAEYKGKAYINGDRRTPSDVLAKETQNIVNEVEGKAVPSAPAAGPEDAGAAVPPRAAEPAPAEPNVRVYSPRTPVRREEAKTPERQPAPEPAPAAAPARPEETAGTQEPGPAPAAQPVSPKPVQPPVPSEPAAVPPAAEPAVTSGAVSDDDTKFFEFFDVAGSGAVKKHADEAERTMESAPDADDEGGEETDKPRRGIFARRNRRAAGEDEDQDAGDASGEEAPFVPSEEEEGPEPDAADEVKRFSAVLPQMHIRSIAAGILCLLMAVVTFLCQGGKSLPFGIGTSKAAATGILLILQYIVMLLGLDVLIDGADDLLSAAPGSESLILVSCVVTALDGMIMLFRRSFDSGLPFSLVSAASVFFAICGRKSLYAALRDSLKMSLISKSPYGVVSESDTIKGRTILKKLSGKTDGFYGRLTRQDSGEASYLRAAPLLLIGSLVLAVLASVGHGRGYSFAHCLAIMTSVAAAFPAASVFALPFRYAASLTKRSGSALAGWGGACDMSDADGALITDEDIFPVGTVSLSGIKLFEGVSQREAIVYASSVIIASDSGLTRVFSELLRGQGFAARRVDDFSCYEGGIGGVVDGERVLVGSGAFMNLMGIRVPDNININNAVFTAVNDELAAVFTLNYLPANSVQGALYAMLNTKMNMLLAVRDFSVTPNMIQQKFKVSMEGVEFIPAQTRYRVSDTGTAAKCGTSAVLCREGLGPFAEVIMRGRLLKLVTDVNTAISICGSAVGLLLMFFLCWTAAFASASAGNAFIFMMAVEACVLLMSQIVKRRV